MLFLNEKGWSLSMCVRAGNDGRVDEAFLMAEGLEASGNDRCPLSVTADGDQLLALLVIGGGEDWSAVPSW